MLTILTLLINIKHLKCKVVMITVVPLLSEITVQHVIEAVFFSNMYTLATNLSTSMDPGINM